MYHFTSPFLFFHSFLLLIMLWPLYTKLSAKEFQCLIPNRYKKNSNRDKKKSFVLFAEPFSLSLFINVEDFSVFCYHISCIMNRFHHHIYFCFKITKCECQNSNNQKFNQQKKDLKLNVGYIFGNCLFWGWQGEYFFGFLPIFLTLIFVLFRQFYLSLS